MIICENEQGEVVGELRVRTEEDMTRVVLHPLEDDEPSFATRSYSDQLTRSSLSSVMLYIEQREYSIIVDQFQQASMRSHSELEQWVLGALRHRIPASADAKLVSHKEPMTGDMVCRVRWQVAVIPAGLSETIFDHHQFTPV